MIVSVTVARIVEVVDEARNVENGGMTLLVDAEDVVVAFVGDTTTLLLLVA